MKTRYTSKQAIKKHVRHKNTTSTLDAKHSKIENTLKKSNQILLQSMFKQFREHILPHVFFVITKSYFTCTIASRVAKSMRVVCETFAREHN